MKIRTGDTVRIIAGPNKGKTAKVVSVQPKASTVKLEGIGMRKRFIKPSSINPQGGHRDIHVALPVHKVAMIHPTNSNKTSRVGYAVAKDGSKQRVARQAGNKLFETNKKGDK